jgi:hypothetical protein
LTRIPPSSPPGRLEAWRAWRLRPAGREGLEHRQRRRQRDVLVDERLHERLERRAVLVERRDRLLADALSRALIGLLVGDEIGRGEKPVLEIVDAEIRGFGIRDRTEMTGDLDAALVRLVDAGLQRGP